MTTEFTPRRRQRRNNGGCHLRRTGGDNTTVGSISPASSSSLERQADHYCHSPQHSSSARITHMGDHALLVHSSSSYDDPSCSIDENDEDTMIMMQMQHEYQQQQQQNYHLSKNNGGRSSSSSSNNRSIYDPMNTQPQELWTGPFRPRNHGLPRTTSTSSATTRRTKHHPKRSSSSSSVIVSLTVKGIIVILGLGIFLMGSVLVDKSVLRRHSKDMERTNTKKETSKQKRGKQQQQQPSWMNENLTIIVADRHYKRVLGYFPTRSKKKQQSQGRDVGSTQKDLKGEGGGGGGGGDGWETYTVHTLCHAFKRDKYCLRIRRSNSKRQIQWTQHEKLIYQHYLENEPLKAADPFVMGDCVPMHEWQTKSFPTCNLLHESDLSSLVDHDHPTKHLSFISTHGDDDDDDDEDDDSFPRVRLVNRGHYRDVWVVPNNRHEIDENNTMKHNTSNDGDNNNNDDDLTSDMVVMKTLCMAQDYTPRNYDRHRRDALVMERLTKSPYIVNIFGYCGNSGIFEYSNEGDIYRAIDRRSHKQFDSTNKNNHHSSSGLTTFQKLEIAVQVAKGLADLHTFEDDGIASVAHTDFGPNQIVKVDGIFKLNDFNRARFIRKHVDTGESCTYRVSGNPGTNRSPEEYSHGDQTERVDTYSMGNTFYILLTEKEVWHNIHSSTEVKNKVKHGERPKLPSRLQQESKDDPAVHALIQAMYMCWSQNQYERASAREIANYLESELTKLRNKKKQQEDGYHERRQQRGSQ